MAALDSPIPTWVTRWLGISAIICVFDGCFCVLRPHTLPGGCLEKVYSSYQLYIEHDTHYGDVTDNFVWTQGLLNLFEAIINFVVVFKLVRNIRMRKMVALVVSTMTFWKTVLYIIYSLDYAQGGHKVKNLVLELLLVYGLGSLWIVFPALVMVTLTQDFVRVKANVSSGSDADDEDETDSRNSSKPTGSRYNLRKRNT